MKNIYEINELRTTKKCRIKVVKEMVRKKYYKFNTIYRVIYEIYSYVKSGTSCI